MKYLLQKGDFMMKEKRSIKMLNLSFDLVAYEDLEKYTEPYVPVGTVEFTNHYCALNKISLPENISYPPELTKYLGRNIRQDIFENVKDEEFVKPIQTKLFTGAIKRDLTERVENNTKVWVSDPVEFAAEYRCYVIDGKVVAHSRYDDGDDEILFDYYVVDEMTKSYYNQPIGYSIDVGVSNGKTVLVEVNDGWSLGLYRWGNMTDSLYVELISRRWQQIMETQ
jgi:hypothetical protein